MLILLLSDSVYSQHLSKAKEYLGKSESDKGFIYEVTKNAKISVKDSWCGAFVKYVLDKVNAKEPKSRTALAQNYYNKGYKTVSVKQVLWNHTKIDSTYIVVWQRGETIFGHVGFVECFINPNNIKTIEGNTSNKVMRKVRKIELYSWFRIKGFSKISYE